jgi:hypothetical protein
MRRRLSDIAIAMLAAVTIGLLLPALTNQWLWTDLVRQACAQVGLP